MSSSSTSLMSRSRSLRKPAGDSQRKDQVPPSSSSPSRLPVKPSASATTRARAGTTSTTTARPSSTSTTTSSSRPTSGIFGRSNTVAYRKLPNQTQSSDATQPVKNGSSSVTSSRTTTTTTRPSSNLVSGTAKVPSGSSRPISFSGLPSASSSTFTKPRVSAHSRAKSSATALTTATALRPPRPPSAASITSTSTTASNISKPSLLTRSNTTSKTQHRRQPSQPNNATPSAASSVMARPSKPTISTTDDAAPRLRPAFNTLQQHYSPARNLAPKPSTASFLAPPTPSKLPANLAISAETARLQTELLQLHLLHRDAASVTANWHASARARLGNRFAELAKENAALGREEADVVERNNIEALKAWGGPSGAELEQKIQVLDIVLSGLWNLTEPGGKYARVVRRFEKWVERMVDVVKARRQGGGLGVIDSGDEIVFVGELDSAWKDECTVLLRKLDGWRRQLRELGEAPEDNQNADRAAADEVAVEPPSLVRILAGCYSQVHGMLAELNIMEQIERDAIRQETQWVRMMNYDDTDDIQKAGAIWRAF